MPSKTEPSVLVTGATGFVGINLLHALSDAGLRAIGLAINPLPQTALNSIAEIGPVPIVELVDVRDSAAVSELFLKYQPMVVIHAAAITAGLERERTSAREIIEVNVGGTQSVLDACTASGVQRMLYLSSGAVYGEAAFGIEKLSETTAAVPAGLYGATKLAGEFLVKRHGQLHGLATVAARLSAVFGPWEHPTGVRDLMSPILQLNMAARRRESSRYVVDVGRNWVYAPEAAAAIVGLALKREPRYDCYNVCHQSLGTCEPWIERLRKAYPDATFVAAPSPKDATVVYDADPRRERALVEADRIQQELGNDLWSTHEDSLDHYLDWLNSHDPIDS